MRPEVITDPNLMRTWSRDRRATGATVGFVPTMGALHEGHGDLVRASRSVDDVTVLSIFVNPTQFNDASDYETYPRTLDADVAFAGDLGVAAVFAPSPGGMYRPGHDTVVRVGAVAEPMEGKHRPGHFDGVATIVTKLLLIVEPDRAWFGAKDWQQVAVVRRAVADLDIAVGVRTVPTRRESDGLAMSSRNIRLDPTARSAATGLWRGLSAARAAHESGVHAAADLRDIVTRIVVAGGSIEVEYVEVVHPETLESLGDSRTGAVICAAIRCGGVRLIDNVELSPRP